MNLSLRMAALYSAAQLLFTAALPARILAHGPVVGGVTSTEARIFVRTDQSAGVGVGVSVGVGVILQLTVPDSVDGF